MSYTDNEEQKQQNPIVNQAINKGIDKGMEKAVSAIASKAGGTSATAAGGAVASGAVAGASAAATGGLSVIYATIVNAAKKAKEIDSPTHDKNGLSNVILVLIIAVVLIIGSVFLPAFLTVSHVYHDVVGVINKGINVATTIRDIITPSEKREFFEEIFDASSFDFTLQDTISMQQGFTSDTVTIYKKIIDKSIVDALTVRCVHIIFEPLAYRIEDAGFLGLFDLSYDPAKTIETFYENPYPYSLAKQNGEFYTIQDYVDGNIPAEELNNDLNYAEILAVLGQNEATKEDAFSYSSFYDIFHDSRCSDLLFEAEFSNLMYYYEDCFGNMHTGSNKDALEEEMETQKEADKKKKKESTEETSGFLESLSDYKIKSYYNIKVYPYGLEELYAIAETDAFANHHTFYSQTNIEHLNEAESWVRDTVNGTVNLGTGYNEERSNRSSIYPLINSVSSSFPTGRSLWSYTDSSITKLILPLTELPLWDKENIVHPSVVYHPTGESVILEMNGYIRQGDYPDSPRGDGTTTIASSGCIDCAYVMAAQYYLQKQISIEAVSKKYVSGDSFQISTFLNDMGITLTAHDAPFSEQRIVNSITAGNPVVFRLRGYWEYDGVVYHSTSNQHYILIVGYDETGFYVYDAGSRNNTYNGVIPYEAFRNVDGKFIHTMEYRNDTFIPNYQTNSILEGQ